MPGPVFTSFYEECAKIASHDPSVSGEDQDRKVVHCVQCGFGIDEDDLSCKKCGVRQVKRAKTPRPPRDQKEVREEDETLQETGGKAATRDARDEMSKHGSLKEKLIKATGIGPKGVKRLNVGIGTGVLATGLTVGVKGPKAMGDFFRGGPPPMERTASRRCINPAYNFKKGAKKKRFKLLEAMARSKR
jgi:hypothetical protein